jgi:hypothetical protein
MGARETGVRDAIVSSMMMQLGEIDVVAMSAAAKASGKPSIPIPRFSADPYDPAFDVGAMHSISDDARLDPMFFGHPLPVIRQALRQIADTWSCDDGFDDASADDVDAKPPPAARVLLSDNVLCEIMWRSGCNDLLDIELSRQLEIAQRAGPLVTGSADVVQLMTMLGLVRHNAGQLLQARETLMQAVALSSATHGDTRQTGVTLLFLGRTEKELGRRGEAIASFRRSLAILDRNPDGGLHLFSVLALLSELLASEGRADEARPLVQRASEFPSHQRGATGLASLRTLAGVQVG